MRRTWKSGWRHVFLTPEMAVIWYIQSLSVVWHCRKRIFVMTYFVGWKLFRWKMSVWLFQFQLFQLFFEGYMNLLFLYITIYILINYKYLKRGFAFLKVSEITEITEIEIAEHSFRFYFPPRPVRVRSFLAALDWSPFLLRAQHLCEGYC